ncbi:phosphotransferase IIA-like nitrogen-regulatory protein PtsN [Hoeflea marina]|uniref:Phosphotransferase IIA-like nitrogen-regulatory protein PtsN n=1 Tax=Hoeflea marina TaxID=274592 RepID=A0A317PHY6_9HYPH|nr:PTS sugar transporter subunit IIA [Hoeflea marina]PWV99048.1 phosphotransferase IIA-like nitrogen-regulatory protein PtsN [Hoeflea marina]
MTISGIMTPGDVLIGVTVSGKPKLLGFVADTAAATLGIGACVILDALEGRERLGSTGIGAGIAIPHAPVDGLAAPFVLLVGLAAPIDFDAIDDRPVDVVCMILTPPGDQSGYLKLLSTIARQLHRPETVKAIRTAGDAAQAYEAIAGCKP